MSRRTVEDVVISSISYGTVGVFALICFLPFLYVVTYSLVPYSEYLKNPFMLYPKQLDFGAYREILKMPLIYSGYRSTLFVTIVGTFLNIILLVMSAYALSKKDLKGRTAMLAIIVFTMFFSGGIIPNYMLIQALGLQNSLWALILPQAINVFYLLLMKSFLQSSIPAEIEESALMDGAGEFTILLKIIFPLSLPAIATFIIFYAVNHWNSYFLATLYISDRDKWPLMVVLREMVVENNMAAGDQQANLLEAQQKSNPFTLKMATIIVTILPIVTLYPFLQKYFIKGLLLGSVKG
jgi:putative aldouronate transport system permease protein